MSKSKNEEYIKERLRRSKIRKETRKIKKGLPHKCEQCRKNTATYYGYHPYYREMYDSITKYKLCTDCYKSAIGDI